MEERPLLNPLIGRREAMRLGLGTLTGAMLVSPLLAACDDDDDDDDSGSGNDAELTPTEPASGAEISDEVFVAASALEPLDLLPWFGSYEQALIEPRLAINESGTVEVELVPWLAES